MGDIRKPYDSSSGDPETGAFIQCVNGIESMINKLWCNGIDRLCREVHPKVRIEILAGTIRELVTEYLSANGLRNRIIGELYINECIQFIRISKIWGNGLPYIANNRSLEATRGWVSTGYTNSIG